MLRRLTVLCAIACLTGCATDADLEAVGVDAQALHSSELLGFGLFVGETFDGNDRTCETCHAIPTLQLSPAQVERAWRRDPSDPLFRPLDSDDYTGASYSRMREDGLVRVHVVAAPNVTIDEVDGVDVTVRPDGRYVVALRRSTPSIFNVGLQDHLMWDGREGDDLAHQAISAVFDHAEPGRAPTALEAEHIAAFQRVLFSSPALARYARGGPAPVLPPGRTASERRGRTFFVSGPLSGSDMAHRGLCATCHSGPMLDTTNAFNPGDPPGLAFAGNRTSEFNERGLPELTYRIALPEDLVVPPGLPLPIPPGTVVAPAGTELVVRTSDPGALIVDTDPTDGVDAANPCISPLPCLTNPGTAIVFHRIPSLWGIEHSAPYFHDNSAATLEDVVLHYRDFFAPTEASLRFTADQAEAAGDLALAMFLRDIADAVVIRDQDVVDIAAYMRLL